ncbi:FUSC family protein [Salipiger sp. PrR002]|uniref:FUSC family protein n=1 Tax=Salipiger sp. PrR002 TaxID=2706489 RepID=UPI0013BA97CA|nr:FUSC family protein [Salipiger sp. PrR002]NDV98489.1 FUSC family protein [Salipiger sp. PrR002]NDW57324.1 FUSC family protein [Salipiger sp. PrR004]
MTAALQTLGFNKDRLTFALRTAFAACLALIIAWLLGLEHPQWAGMTVWAASQPVRGQLLEKGLFRFAGTVVGTIAGIGLIFAMLVHPALLVIGLALWVGLCTGLANLARGFVAYGTVLAGYTAAMVSLLDVGHPENVLALGADRMATVLVGVVAALLVGWLFAPAADGKALRGRIRALLADLCEQIAAPEQDAEAARGLISAMAGAEEALDPHAAGSLRSHRETRATRNLLFVALSVLLWRRGRGADAVPEAARLALTEAAAALRADDGATALKALERAAALPGLGETLRPLATALTQWRAPENRSEPAPETVLPVVLHRDWIGAREAAIRATGALLLFGALWQITGFAAGAFLLLGMSIMISIFTTFENPIAMLPFVFLGQFMGAAMAIAIRWLIWPHASTEWQMVAMMLPFILLGAFLSGHDRGMKVSFDYNMVMLLLLHPALPLTGSFGTSVMMGLAVVAAPLAALAAYRTIYPPTLRRKQATLARMMLHDVAALAADPTAPQHRDVWRARLYHRMLRLFRLTERSARAQRDALDTGLALLDLGHAAMRAQEILAAPDTPATERRALCAALARLKRLEQTPARAKGALSRLARRAAGQDAEIFRHAARSAGLLGS